ncbi:MAG: hypothetical protein ABI588_00255 [Arenimonas sp.]
MALKILLVTLNNDDVLDVSDGGDTGIDRARGVEIIVWKLSGSNLNGAEFADETPDGSGFNWIDKSTGIFSQPLLSANRRRMIMEDDHPNAGSAGHWIYMLSVRLRDPDANGKPVFRTTTNVRGKKRKKDTRTTNNPVIINR